MKKFRITVGRKANIFGFAVVAIMAILAIVTGIGDTVDRQIRQLRYEVVEHNQSGNIVFVAMDDKSLKVIGDFPWKRSTHANLINSLQDKNIKKLGFDVGFVTDAANVKDDIAMETAIKSSKFPVGLAVPGNDKGGEANGNEIEGMWPIERYRNAGAELFSIWTDTNENGEFEHGNPYVIVDGKPLKSIALWISGVEAQAKYLVNWSRSPTKIESYSYSDILNNKIPAGSLEGKTLLVGPDSSVMGDYVLTAQGNYTSGARAQIIAAETLITKDLGSIDKNIVVILTLIICGIIAVFTKGPRKHLQLATTGFVLLGVQFFRENEGGQSFPVGEAIGIIAITMVVVAITEMLNYFHARMTTNEDTGIPNLRAMKLSMKDKGSTIVIQLNNHLDILAELGSEGRDKVINKIAKRVELGSNGKPIYQIDTSSLAWRGSGNKESDIEQIQSIIALLRPGVPFANGTIDVYVSVGIELDDKLGTEKAVNNASIAASRAQDRGIAWEIYAKDDSDELWKISVVSEISNAIKNKHIWVAYQPKVDSKTSVIRGAEALVRWKHPERGDIRPDAFIPLLEKASRTEELTEYMLRQAAHDFSELETENIAVNVSPTMIGEGVLKNMIKKVLKESGFDPARLTIEVTESEKFGNEQAVRELEEIKKLGVKISIDDYGMGNSTVNYLRILPADELKIDRSFIANVLANQSDRMVVASTIHLAHEIGLKVVAEGVESSEIQAYLNELNCDFIQGYHTGKPVSFEQFKLAVKTAKSVASQKAA